MFDKHYIQSFHCLNTDMNKSINLKQVLTISGALVAALMLVAAPSLTMSALAFKDLRGIWLPYVSTSTQKDIYCDQEVSSDQNVLHLGAGVTSIPDGTSDGLFTCPASLQVVEVFSIADAKAIGADAKARGYDVISYDLESGNSPSNETSDPVAAFTAMANYVHNTLHLKLQATPSKAITDAHATEIAKVVDRYHIQSQSQQDNTSTFGSYVHDRVADIKKGKSTLASKITFQVSLTRSPPSGVNFVQLLKNDLTAGVNNGGAGASVFFAKNDNSTGDLNTLVTWWHCTYTGGSC